ncbi:uncharacterized protein LOC135400627 [Ornithodoros turicata]|uniref:uncharacterized protein LOC135400627 n=1 Tax=Ornithodoros turicata TaxID=34597 RepID=UPI003138F4A1
MSRHNIPIDTYPPAYALIKKLLMVYRFYGCCFIAGLHRDGTAHLKPRRLTCYILYTILNIGIVIAGTPTMVNSYWSSGKLTYKVFALVSVWYVVQALSTVIAMLVHAEKLVELVKVCARYESRHPPSASLRRRSKWVLVLVLSYFTFDISLQNTPRVMRIVSAKDLDTVLYNAYMLTVTVIVTPWGTMFDAGLVCWSYLLAGYMRDAVARLSGGQTEDFHLLGSQRTPSATKRLRAFRSEMSFLKYMLTTANDMLQVGLTMSFGCSLVRMFVGVYYAVTGELPLYLNVLNTIHVAMVTGKVTTVTLFAEKIVKEPL